MTTIVECVPNFSEGNDSNKIEAITSVISTIDGITLLDVDPGKDTNRTVVTFVGSIDAIEEAAFQAIRKASEVIDMRQQKGAHPRMGATDICPFIPVSGVTMDDCVELSKRVGKRVGEELGIPIYLYEYSAQTPERKNLAKIREGEYEGLANKLADPNWVPDFGPANFNARSGATVMGGRDFLIAYNVNLNTRDKRLATDIAFELREKGRTIRIPHRKSHNYLDGEIIRYQKSRYPCSYCDNLFDTIDDLVKHSQNKHEFDLCLYWRYIGYDEKNLLGKAVKKPGFFKSVKAIGWYIDTFRRAQISINFTNYHVSPIHEVFDKTCKIAEERGVRVTGSELVGLIPLEAILMAGRHYLKKQNQTPGVPEEVVVETAIQSLGLNDVTPFNPEEKIIDYAVKQSSNNLMNLPVKRFLSELSVNSPAPGGGSVSALVGSLGAALSSMVAALTHDKKGYLERKALMAEIGDEAQKLKDRLLFLVDEDTNAFNGVMAANRLPVSTKEEIATKSKAILTANRYATQIPLEVAKLSFRVLELAHTMVKKGNPNSASDAGVSGEVAMAGIRGACLNILINLANIADDETFVKTMEVNVEDLLEKAELLHKKVFSNTLDIIKSDE